MNNLGLTESNTYGRLVQVIDGYYYDGFGNPLDIGASRGTSGYGSSGVYGANGSSGSIGENGSSGSSGENGSSGSSGENGSSGSSGENGSSGSSGYSGSSGENGSSGSSGENGSSGSSGSSGENGSSGSSGTSGSSGSSGTSGSSGSSGTSGSSGSSGEPLTEVIILPPPDDINKIFYLTTALTVGTQHMFFINGQLLTYGKDYDIVGTTLTIYPDRPAPEYLDVLRLFGSVGTVMISGSSGTSGVDGMTGTSGSSGVDGVMGAVSVANGVVLYFDSSTSGIGDYEVISTYPDTNIEKDEYTSVTNQTLEFEQYSTILSLGRTLIDAGLWEFGLYTYVDVNSGTSSLIASVYSRTSGGTESLLFNVESHPITNTVVGLNITEIVQPQFIINSSDLLVVKISAKTTSLTPVNVHFVHSGNVNYSHIKTPLITLHNTVAGLQGGNLTERYHLSLSEYNGTGTGVMVRQSSPTITGAITAGSFIMSGGTSSQYLMSDGSVSNIIDVSGKANIVSPTFTGTVILPTTTSIGNVSSTELSYIDGVTSGIQAQLNTKITANTSTNNYVPKVSGTNTFANSRIIDTGTYLGIGSVNTPTKDITLGNQLDREIGIEESDNTIIGKSFRISAGRTINYISNSNFNLMSQVVSRVWIHIKGHPNGDTYGVSGGVLYKQVNSVGEFVAITTGITGITGLYITSSSDIYICVNGGYCYKQTNSTGSFVQFGQIGAWVGIAVYNNIDVYTVSGWGYNPSNSYLYKQTGGVGNLVLLDTQRQWTSIDTSVNGVYATSMEGLYFQNAGVGNFNIIRSGNAVYVGIDNANNLYLNEYNGQYHIFKQNNSIGVFEDLFVGHSDLWFRAIGFDKNNNVYVSSVQSTIWYKQTYAVGAPNLDGGTLKILAGTGKGIGSSNLDFYTGQKLPSGTDMQVETLRARINNEGLMTLPSTTNALITADVTGKAVITKEYVDVSQITITATASITTGTTASNGFGQKGKNVIIDNGSNAINITVDGGTDFVSSYVKHGSGAITFVQGSGRSLIQVDGTVELNGATGSTATIASIGTTDYLRISNA